MVRVLDGVLNEGLGTEHLWIKEESKEGEWGMLLLCLGERGSLNFQNFARASSVCCCVQARICPIPPD